MRASAISTAITHHTLGDPLRSATVARRPISLPIVTRLLAAVDALAVLMTGFTAMAFLPSQGTIQTPLAIVLLLFGTILTHDLLRAAGTYRSPSIVKRRAGIDRVALTWTVAAALIGLLSVLIRPVSGPLAIWLAAWTSTGLIALAVVRLGLAALMEKWRTTQRLCRNVAVVGAGPLAERLLRHLDASSENHVRIVGLYDERRAAAVQACAAPPVKGTIDTLLDDIKWGGIDEVVLAIPSADNRRIGVALKKLSAVSVTILQCCDTLSFRPPPCRIARVADLTLLAVTEAPLSESRGIIKAIEDRFLATFVLAALGPVMAAIAILIKCDSPGPALFHQVRHGLNNRLIDVLKFRTMYERSADPNAETLTQRNDPRVTKLGAILRRTMLDELPQLINVLRGEMSIVGPRPHALRAKAGGRLYRDAVPNYDARHRMKPGITGWAQVNGWRGTTEIVEQIEQRVACDLFYIENWSVRFDLAILLRTLLLPVRGLFEA